MADAATFSPKEGAAYAVILSDMNGDARDAIAHVIRLSKFLHKCGLVVFTLKTPGAATYQEMNSLESSVLNSAAAAGLRLFARTHLTYNRHEFTLFFEYKPFPAPAQNAL